MKRTQAIIALLFVASLILSTTACRAKKGGKKGCNCPSWQKPTR